MADFDLPKNDTLAELVLDYLKAQVTSVAKMFNGTTDSNVPDGAVRYNGTANKFQNKDGETWSNLGFHTAIDSHIANSALHAAVPTGALLQYGGSTAPTGYLLCQGQAVSRSTYSGLFTAIGVSFGSGDGTTTFNLPDLREKLPLGRNTSGSYQTLGGSGGSMDHTHSTPNHTHTTATHTHTFSHTHATPAHQHNIAGHTHTTEGHHHWATANGGDINIAASGSHQHNIKRTGSDVSASGYVATPDTEYRNDSVTVNNSLSDHTHPAAAFGGRVGLTSGANGDYPITSSSTALVTTAGEGGGTTTSQSTSTTSGSGILTTDSGGGSTTGVGNPPYLILNYIIKT